MRERASKLECVTFPIIACRQLPPCRMLIQLCSTAQCVRVRMMTACPAWLQLFWYAGLREAGVGVSSKEDQSTSMPAESRGRLHAYILALRWISLTGFSTDGRTDGRLWRPRQPEKVTCSGRMMGRRRKRSSRRRREGKKRTKKRRHGGKHLNKLQYSSSSSSSSRMIILSSAKSPIVMTNSDEAASIRQL